MTDDNATSALSRSLIVACDFGLRDATVIVAQVVGDQFKAVLSGTLQGAAHHIFYECCAVTGEQWVTSTKWRVA